MAFGNRAQGFYANHHPGGLDFIDNTSFRNSTSFDMLVEGGPSTHLLRNNVAVPPGTAMTRYSGGTDAFNSWTLPVSVSAADFLSLDESEALAPRQADGSLPNVSFLHLAPGSDLIDQGQDVGFPYNGAAPDLGAFESGVPLGAGGSGIGGTPGIDAGTAGVSSMGGEGGSDIGGNVAGGDGPTSPGSGGATGGGSAIPAGAAPGADGGAGFGTYGGGAFGSPSSGGATFAGGMNGGFPPTMGGD